DPYKALWADIVAQRNNAPSHLSQASTRIDMTPWPAPIIRSFLGRMPPEAVLAAADDADAKKKKSQACEANFYGGELALRLNAKDEAVRLFRLAAGGCAKNVDEGFSANAGLKALGEKPWAKDLIRWAAVADARTKSSFVARRFEFTVLPAPRWSSDRYCNATSRSCCPARRYRAHGRREPCSRRRLPQPVRTRHRALSSGRADRPHRPPGCPNAHGIVWPGLLCGERERGKRRARRANRRRRAGRWLYLDGGDQRSRDRARDVDQGRLRCAQEFRTNQHHLTLAVGASAASVGTGKDRPGVCDAGPRGPCKVQLRIDEPRAKSPEHRKAFSSHFEASDCPHPLPGGGAHSQLDGGRPYPRRLHRASSGNPIHQGRHAAGIGGHQSNAISHRPGRADHGGERSCGPGNGAGDRPGGTGSHAAVDRGTLGAPDGGVRCPAANAATPRGVRVYCSRQYAGRICRPNQIRYRSSGCGRSGRRDQSRLSRSPRGRSYPHIRRAVSHNRSSLRLSSSMDRLFPRIEEAKPH